MRCGRHGARGWWRLPALLTLLLGWNSLAATPATEDALWLTVAQPYAELRTGPGRGYPVFHVVERGEDFRALRQRTDWVLVEARDGTRGWMHRATLELAETPGGQRVRLGRAGFEDWRQRRIEAGFGLGDFEGDPLFSFRAGYRLGRHFVAEAQLLQAAGSFSSTTVWHANLQVLPFPDARIAPFFSLGAGRLSNEPKSTLVDAEKVSEWAGNAGVGLRGWLTRRFLVRGDLRHFVFTRDVNNNDDFTELSLGFSVFF
ncbi:MAG: SH3 domain-containing protein [Gammaproteobacteria bacterium]